VVRPQEGAAAFEAGTEMQAAQDARTDNRREHTRKGGPAAARQHQDPEM
jgi:hypothetical protein